MSDLILRVEQLPAARDLPPPEYMTAQAAGMDLRAAVPEPITLAPGAFATVPTGIRLAIPAGFEGQVRPRSGLAAKHGIGIVNSPGTIDADYRTNPADRGIIGHSYGGDFVLYALFHAPELFSRYMAGSPNFSRVASLERAYAESHTALPVTVLLSVGERDDASSTEQALSGFVDILASRAYEGLELTTLVFPGATHFASRPLHHVSGVYAMYSLR